VKKAYFITYNTLPLNINFAGLFTDPDGDVVTPDIGIAAGTYMRKLPHWII